MVQRWRKATNPLLETVCAETNGDHFGENLFRSRRPTARFSDPATQTHDPFARRRSPFLVSPGRE